MHLRGLIFGLVLALLGVTHSPTARASSNQSYDAAVAACNEDASHHGPSDTFSCQNGTIGQCSSMNGSPGSDPRAAIIEVQHPVDGSQGGCRTSFPYNGIAPGPCDDKPDVPGVRTDGSAACFGGCSYEPIGGGQNDSVRSGPWLTMLSTQTYRSTGKQCIPGTPDTISASPRVCGGGSCHDTATGSYCAVGSAGQVCLSAAAAAGPGGCVSMGDTTLCAGASPPAPPNPPIADPVTGITASDTYGHQDGGGAINNTTVNNYNNTNSAPKNGAAAGDSGDAPGSANPKPGSGNDPAHSGTASNADNTHASGGGTCDTPPICEGNQATCMVVTQTWLARCKGDGVASVDSDTSVPGLEGIGDGTVTGGGRPWFSGESTLLDKLDSSGFGGGNQCPSMPNIEIPMFNVDYTADWPQWCEILHGASYVILLLAGFLALRILSE